MREAIFPPPTCMATTCACSAGSPPTIRSWSPIGSWCSSAMKANCLKSASWIPITGQSKLFPRFIRLPPFYAAEGFLHMGCFRISRNLLPLAPRLFPPEKLYHFKASGLPKIAHSAAISPNIADNRKTIRTFRIALDKTDGSVTIYLIALTELSPPWTRERELAVGASQWRGGWAASLPS